MQETEVDANLNENLLQIPGYYLELEQNEIKKRVGIYIKRGITYKRLNELEGMNNHLVIIEI